MRRAATALAALLALASAGCGDSGNDKEATALLERGFATDVDTGSLTLDMEVDLEGIEQGDTPFRLRLDGQFRSRGASELPDADMTFRASGMGQSVSGRLVLLPENAWIEFRGETYEVGEELWSRARESLSAQQGPDTFEEAGIDPFDWVEDAETEGEEEVSGAATSKVTAALDLERMLRDFNRLAEEGERIPRSALEDADEFVDPLEFEAWIGADDIWRRITVDTELDVPENERDALGGLEGGRISLDVRLEQPNEPVEIEAVSEARPLTELLQALGIPPESLGLGLTVPEPG